MALIHCPPCSGSGRKRAPDGRDTLVDHGLCPLCKGAGEADEREVDTFWECVTHARDNRLMIRVPWVCAQGADSWL